MIYAGSITEYPNVPYFSDNEDKYSSILFSKTTNNYDCSKLFDICKIDRKGITGNVIFNIIIQEYDIYLEKNIYLTTHLWLLKQINPKIQIIPDDYFEISATFSAGVYPLKNTIIKMPEGGEIKTIVFKNTKTIRHVKQGIGIYGQSYCYAKIKNKDGNLSLRPNNSCNFKIKSFDTISETISIVKNLDVFVKENNNLIKIPTKTIAVNLHIIVPPFSSKLLQEEKEESVRQIKRHVENDFDMQLF